MKRFLAVFLLFTLFSLGAFAASYDPYSPDSLIETVNQALPLILRVEGKNENVIEETQKRLNVTYTEQEGTILYYNNPDWKVEFSFFYPEKADAALPSTAVNFVLSSELSSEDISDMLYAYAIAICYGNDEMDPNTLHSWLLEPANLNNLYTSPIGTFSNIPGENGIQIALFKESNADLVPAETSQPLASQTTKPQPSAPLQNVLVEGGGVTVQYVSAEPFTTASFPATIRINLHIINNYKNSIMVRLFDSTVNGTEVAGIGAFGIKANTDTTDEWILLSGKTQSAWNAVCNAKSAKFTIQIQDESSREILGVNTVTLDLSSLPYFTPYPSPRNTPEPEPGTVTAAPTAKPTAKPTARPTATPRTKSEIKWLHFSDRLWAEWDNESANRLKIRFEIVSDQYPIKSFDMYVYATNFMGERIYGDNFTYNFTTNRSMTSYRTAWSDYIRLPQRSSINEVYCGIKRVTLRDGSVEEIPDSDIVYYYWTIH
ncbi:MAG: PT domain-containing protein [Clostridia bacterium]|nr:PT domain-containing protein [Clostridia bacterium]